MRKWTMLMSMVVVLCFVAGMLVAAEPGAKTEKPKPLMANGVVKSYDDGTKVLVVTVKHEKEGVAMDMSFTLTDDTKITAGKEAKGVDALTEGVKVQVAYKKDGDTLTAVAIQIAPGTEKPKGAK